MFIQSIVSWAKSLALQFQKPESYGSALESYIVANNPQDASDVDRLAREFDNKMSNRQYQGYPL